MVQLPRLGKRELVFCYCIHVIIWFLFLGGFSSNWYLGWVALFYCAILFFSGSSINYLANEQDDLR